MNERNAVEMERAARIEAALKRALRAPGSETTPPTLAGAMVAAVFGGGGRLRPMLTLAVAEACGDPLPRLSEAAAAAVELLHCASLVHDDLPCFDDADVRRGRPSVHRAFGEPAAVLTGDALVVLAFEQLARVRRVPASRVLAVMQVVAGGAGHAGGIISGQGWELEPSVELHRYHGAKTGALFEAAASAGALSAGADPAPWRRVGGLLGEAYQVADDLADALGDPRSAGKPAGQDARFARPSAVQALGLEGAYDRLDALEQRALDAIPPVVGRLAVQTLVVGALARLRPSAPLRAAM